MMILKRPGSLVIGLTDENIETLRDGHALKMPGTAGYGTDVFLVQSDNNESFREALRAEGYEVEANAGETGSNLDGD